ncbi:MAG: hypothetical protein DWQ39_02360 [Bacteroidetes bacterium]|nr:MAG: hypothetical protein DWQ39_02360 [Bacteroidota bacterium]REK48625.1 MAG: hypothetical protein DWQ48_09770 [Bacteroidota bacterium]
MKKILILSSVLIIALSQKSFSQVVKDPVIMQIDDESITKSEFERVFRKNNTKDTKVDSKAVNEYLQLYINYKLKVKEALSMGMDTVAAFVEELAGYRKQLAQPYLVDKAVTENLVREAHERMKTDVRASHILIKCEQNALPKDTQEAYNKAMKVRSELLRGGDFSALAKKYSDDPSAKENGGDLGYFTVLQMVYPFESAAYNTKVGEISLPVRTRFGYHLVKTIDTRPAQGDVKVAHIMVKTSPGQTPEDSLRAAQKINEIHDKLKAGEKFEELARQYSDDPSSARNGGTLPVFSTGKMVPEFEKAAFALQNVNDVSGPVKTSYGWHIIKLLEKKPIGNFETLQNDIRQKVQRDSRSDLSRYSMISRIKEKYGFTENAKSKTDFMKRIDSTLSEGNWTIDKADGLKSTMFTIGNKAHTQDQFALYIANHQSKRNQGMAPLALANHIYSEWVMDGCIAYEESKLDSLYPDFRNLMQEYRDGILLFELTDKKVWSKAVKDTAGLKEFYEKNKMNYMWSERLEATIYTCANAEISAQVRKLMKKVDDPDTLMARVNKNSQLNLQVKYGKFPRGENDIIDQIDWKPGVTKDIVKDKQVVFAEVKRVLPAQPKSLEEAKGLVTADYQNALEKEWIEELKKKYTVKVNQDVVDSVASK